MAGPFDIQRVPVALLDLLGLKATGDTPHQLAQETKGVIDQWDLYTIDRLQARQFTFAIAGLGTLTNAFATPPAGAMWFVYGADIATGAVAAAATIKAGLGIQRGTGAPVCRIPDLQSPRLVATESFTAGWWTSKPLIMRPGDILATLTVEFTGAPAVTPAANLVFVELGR